jgi:cellulose synthase/poly-beta-1,6-N-acetylglucosamine synthase-like glycosyltransferase
MTELTDLPSYGPLAAALFGLSLVTQLFILLFRFLKTANHKVSTSPHVQPVSVLIAARNEEKNLLENVPKIMAQEHPNFEVIILSL